MGLGQHLRRWGLAAVLAATSFGSLQAAERGDVDDVSIEAVAYEQSLATPMLSARRIPRTLQAPVIDDGIRPDIAAIVRASPQDSCLLVRVGDRTLLPSSNIEVGLLPASNQKLLTTYAALVLLGDDFRYRTTVVADAETVDGVIDGNLYLIGDGDPFLSTDEWWTQYEFTDGRHRTRLEDLADAVGATGVTSITGELIGDESLFDNLRQGPWAERLIAGKQSGPLSALTVNEGFVDWPAVYAGSSRQRFETDDPPLHAAAVFGQLLAERGITIGGTNVGTAPSGTDLIAEVISPPLTDLITHINSYSSNIGAELLLKRLGVDSQGIGSTVAGAQVLLDVLASSGIPIQGLVIADGSGLSENNRVTCQALGAVLSTTGPSSTLAASLAIGATRGSLLQRFVDTAAAGAVYAKTGTLNDATALSGFVRSATEPDVWITFAYLANEELIIADDEVTGLQDPFVVALTSYPGPPTILSLSPLPPVDN